MKLLNIAVSILLIPSLVAGDQKLSHDAKALLKRPRLGAAEITWGSGTHNRADIVRVTDGFVALRSGSGPTCENVEWARIAKVKWYKPGHSEPYFPPLAIALLIPLIPIVVIEELFTHPEDIGTAFELIGLLPAYGVQALFSAAKRSIGHHDPKLGSWEAAHPQPGQGIERIKFDDRQGQRIERQVVAVRAGRYRLEDGKLYTRYDDDADNETSALIRFECDELVSTSPVYLRLRTHTVPDHAGAPIVGRWWKEHGVEGPDIWEFRADGTFQVERLLERSSGFYKKTDGTVDIQWTSPSPGREAWHVGRKNGYLSIVRGIETNAFKRRPQFD